MLCLDSYVLMDILSGKEDRILKCKKFLSETESGGGVISSTAITEVFFHIARRANAEEASKSITFIRAIPNLQIIDVTVDIATLAATLRAKYYKPKEREISFLDCIHLATAIATGCSRFVTGDKDFKDVEEINVEVY